MYNYFFLVPDYQTISQYYNIKQSKDFFLKGVHLEVEDYYSPDETTHYFSQQDIKNIENRFKSILRRYNLAHHYDDLMYLALCYREDLDAVRFALENEYLPMKRIQELAQLLLAFKESARHNRNSLQLKTYKGGASVKDYAVLDWVGETLLEAATLQKNMSIGDFSLAGGEITDDIDQLRELANRSIPKPKLDWKYYLSDFCFFLYPYLINETNIRPDKATIVSDDQLKLYFDLLTLLHMIDPDKITSEPQDYMRTILRNRIKNINA